MDKVIQEGAPYIATAYEIAKRQYCGAVRWALDAVYPTGRRTVISHHPTPGQAKASATMLAGRVGRIVVRATPKGN